MQVADGEIENLKTYIAYNDEKQSDTHVFLVHISLRMSFCRGIITVKERDHRTAVVYNSGRRINDNKKIAGVWDSIIWQNIYMM